VTTTQAPKKAHLRPKPQYPEDMPKLLGHSLEFIGKLRRFLDTQFRKDKTAASISKRRGACRRCGSCCAIVFRCPFLTKSNSCSIYSIRPKQCRLYPINQKDLRFREHVCGFHFDTAPESDVETPVANTETPVAENSNHPE